MKILCELANVNRTNYYKWLKRPKAAQDDRNQIILDLISEIHEKHPSHGYRWINAMLKRQQGLVISNNFAYKCCRYLGIKAESKHYSYKKPREESNAYENIVKRT